MKREFIKIKIEETIKTVAQGNKEIKIMRGNIEEYQKRKNRMKGNIWRSQD